MSDVNDPPPEGPPEDGGDPGGFDDPTFAPNVNPQIIDAVGAATGFAFGLENQLYPQSPAPGTRLSAGAAIAYEKAAQAAGLAVQDAADYQRNVMSISTVAQGKALAMMFADQANIEKYAIILVLAMITPLAAALTAGVADTEATTMLTDFPRA
jgi:hypothetical protein